jgi:predicted RND superfamily exporter protein
MTSRSSWTRRTAFWLYDRRWNVLVGALLLTIIATLPAMTVHVDTAVQNWFAEGDPALQAYRDFQETYGNDEVVLIGLQRSDGLLTPGGLSLLRTATERVRSIDGVASVASLTTQSRVQTTLAGPQLVPLVSSGRRSAEQAAALRAHIQSDSAYARLVSDSGTMAAVYARMERNAMIDGKRGAILDAIQQKLAPLDASVHLAGTGVILNAISEATTLDVFVFIGLSGLVIFLLLFAYFRRTLPVVVTLGIVGATTVWLMGIYGWAGRDINMVTLVMPTLVLVVCTANCVHLLVYAAHQPKACSPRRRTVRTLDAMATPCLLTTLTTAAGFASLTASSMPVIRDLGLFSAVGVMAGLVLTFVGCAAVLPYEAALPCRPEDSRLQHVTDTVVDWGLRRWGLVLGGTVLLAGAAGLGLSRISVDTNHFDYLYYNHEVRQDSRLIERTLGPYAPLEFVVRSDASENDRPGGDGNPQRAEFGFRPDLLRAVGQWQDRAVATGDVEWHRSSVNALRRLHAALPGGTATVPQDQGRLQGLVQLGQKEFPYLRDLQAHPDQVRVTFGLPIQSADGVRQAIDTVKDAAALPGTVTTRATGFLPLYVQMMSLLVDALVSSFGLALLVIVGMIALIFRSLRAAALSLIPNVLPVLLTLGLMGWVGIPLNVATMTIAAVVFGLVVDDTIHLFRHYVDARCEGGPVAAIRESAHHTGRRMAITTSVLAAGFLVLCFAQIKSVAWVGGLSAVAIVVALAADLLVLPAVLAAICGTEDAPLASASPSTAESS